MSELILSTRLQGESDLVALRQQARAAAAQLGFDVGDQTRIATAVSEIARNALVHGGGGSAEFWLESREGRDTLRIRINDQGPGFPAGGSPSPGPGNGGLGLVGARRLMDAVTIDTQAGQGTTVELFKTVPRRASGEHGPAPSALRTNLRALHEADPYLVLRDQNRDLIRSLAELTERNAELERISTELEDTNRGVVALYAELDTRAEQLREASELKSRFLSNMSHEFRTPLNSILALARLLLDRTDGDLAPEQEKQVTLIRRSAETLREMVDDLLDLAKVEAGKIDVRPVAFRAGNLFGALRGALRPLQVETVPLVIEEPGPEVPDLFTDEGKVAQILRNLISNALKFTETGEVRVKATASAGEIVFSVADTGIGIPAREFARIFEEFEQVEGPLQTRQKGTGLGLPLSRKLAQLLGGDIEVRSEPGKGSTFSLRLPARFGARPPQPQPQPQSVAGPRRRLLVVDDQEAFRYVVRQMTSDGQTEIIEATDGEEGLRLARSQRPDAVILDLQMPGLDGEKLLEEFKADPELAGIPVVVLTSRAMTGGLRRQLAHARSVIAKGDLTRAVLAGALAHALGEHEIRPAGEYQ